MTVTVYTAPACMQCRATKRALERAGVEFEMIDVSQDEQAHELVTSMGYRQAPVVMAGDQHWGGFRPDLIQELAQQVA